MENRDLRKRESRKDDNIKKINEHVFDYLIRKCKESASTGVRRYLYKTGEWKNV